MEFIKKRLTEKWTYAGLFLLLSTFAGVELSDTQQFAISFFAMVLVGTPDDKLASAFARKKL